MELKGGEGGEGQDRRWWNILNPGLYAFVYWLLFFWGGVTLYTKSMSFLSPIYSRALDIQSTKFGQNCTSCRRLHFVIFKYKFVGMGLCV